MGLPIFAYVAGVQALLAYYPIFLIAKGLRVSDENMHVTAFTESHLPVHFVVHEALGTLMHWKVPGER